MKRYPNRSPKIDLEHSDPLWFKSNNFLSVTSNYSTPLNPHLAMRIKPTTLIPTIWLLLTIYLTTSDFPLDPLPVHLFSWLVSRETSICDFDLKQPSCTL